MLFLWDLLLGDGTNPNAVTTISGWVSVVGLVIGALLYRRTPLKITTVASVSIYALLLFATGSLVVGTGGLSSPYMALWMIVAILSGMFGLFGIGLLLGLVNIFIIYILIVNGYLEDTEIVIAVLAGEVPVALSWLFWVIGENMNVEADPDIVNLNKQVEKESLKTDTIIESIGDGVIVVKQTGEITAINPAAQRMTGWSGQDALKLHFSSVVKLEDEEGTPLNDERNPIYKTLNTSQQSRTNKVRIITKAGRKIDLDFVVSPTEGSDLGEGAIAIFRDITKEKAEGREQAEFISTASHEMRTPVAAIEGYLGLALNPTTATIDAKAREYIEKAQNSAEHLGRLFQDLLDVSKADDGKLKSNPTVIDSVSFARDIVDSFKTKASNKQIKLTYLPDGSKATIGTTVLAPVLYSYVDKGHLREVLDNLVENAIKYTPDGGQITVDTTGQTNETVRFIIKDTGLGIPEEDINHLFQKFYRVDSSQTREIGGTGLGLYLCRKLVESMHGRIWVESQLGSGSSFIVEVPRIDHLNATMLQEREKANIPETPVPMPTVPPTLATNPPQPALTLPPQQVQPIAEPVTQQDQPVVMQSVETLPPSPQPVYVAPQPVYESPQPQPPIQTTAQVSIPTPIQTTTPTPVETTPPQPTQPSLLQVENNPNESPQPLVLPDLSTLPTQTPAPTQPIPPKPRSTPTRTIHTPRQMPTLPPLAQRPIAKANLPTPKTQPAQPIITTSPAIPVTPATRPAYNNIQRPNVNLADIESNPEKYIPPRQ